MFSFFKKPCRDIVIVLSLFDSSVYETTLFIYSIYYLEDIRLKGFLNWSIDEVLAFHGGRGGR